MNIQINDVNFNAEAQLMDFARKKAEKLYGLYEGIVGVEVTYKLENSHEENNKTAEIRIKVPGNDLFAKKTQKSFEEATEASVLALRKQLEKFKDKVR